jgi:hypothetical protein
MIDQRACTAAARAALLQPLALLIVGLVSWPPDWERLQTVLDSLRGPEPSRAPGNGHSAGYYEVLIGAAHRPAGSRGEPWTHPVDKPDAWVGLREADVIRFLEDDFLQFELKPSINRNLFGQPFVTNAFGMHDDPVAIDKPEGTFRIAVLGASIDMGWGVKYQDTYINRLEAWLDTCAANERAASPRRFEVLNFAVMAYSPLQRLDALRRKVMAFRPDLVLYSATTLDIRLLEIHVCEMLRKRVDLRYDFLRDVVHQAGIGADVLRIDADEKLIHKKLLRAKLKPHYWGLYDQTLSMIAAECRAADVPLVMAIIPRVGREDAPGLRAEPVALLHAMAAHQAVKVLDLSGTFDSLDAATLEIDARDDHPNAMGHEWLFRALARALTQDPALSRLLFPPETNATTAPAPPSPGDQRPTGTRANGDPDGFVARQGRRE